jgi:hypothetical protein
MAMMDRRTALEALTGSAATALGWSAVTLSREQGDSMLDQARGVLRKLTSVDPAVRRDIPVPLGRLPWSVPQAGDAADPPRLVAGAADLPAGSYILDRERGLIDALVSVVGSGGRQPEPVTARFTFADGPEPRLRTASFGASAPARFTLSTGILGISGAGDRDVSEEVQQAYDQLARTGGGILFFPPGEYAVALKLSSRTVSLAGAGMGSTRLVPARPGEPVLQAVYTSGTWSVVEIADLEIRGRDGGTGFLAGHRSYQPGDEYAGRTRSVRYCFARWIAQSTGPPARSAYGSMGCVFEGGKRHLVGMGHDGPGDPMHAGNLIARDCHFQGAGLAVCHLRSKPTGSGQIVFDNCIFELNSGYVLLVEQLNNLDATPSLTLRSCWNEANATAASVHIDGHASKPAFADLTNTGMVRFEDTPVGSLRLRNATVTTLGCPLDRLTIEAQDAASTVEHYAARGFGSYQPAGLVHSVAAAYQFLPNRNLFFTMPARQRRTPTSSDARLLLGGWREQVAFVDASTGVPVYPVGQGWRVNAGQQLRFSSVASIAPSQWVAWLFQYELLAPATIWTWC